LIPGRWNATIGDPTPMGWLTVLAYAVAAYLCLRVYLQSGQQSGRERLSWLFLSALMAFLCINKQLDLQSLFVQVLRDMARADGWYSERRLYQARFVKGFALVGALVGAIVMIFAMRARNIWARVAALGTLLIIGFIVIRAASFHHVDVVLKSTLAGLRYNWILELTPISLIIVSAWKTLGRARVVSA
jgi:hypothetical protein